MKVKEWYRTCSSHPSQWDIYTEDGDYIYVRYRGGIFSVEKNGEEILNERIGEFFDGSMSDEQMQELTKEILEW